MNDTEIIQQRLNTYQANTLQEEENALKEIAQEIALLALSRSDFFKLAAFQGGTCLRILYGLNRFSEDLDFILQNSNAEFSWQSYMKDIQEEFAAYGYTISVQDRSKVDNVIKKAFIKDDSIGKLLVLQHKPAITKKIQIKLEIDTNPPAGSNFEIKYLDFPLPFAITTQDMPSLFASKCHALLCREYTKGRDWYDFVWHVGKRTGINFNLLGKAIYQMGPWHNQPNTINKNWLIEQLTKKIKTMDWEIAKNDVSRFLKPREAETLKLWTTDFFLHQTGNLKDYL
ncbi:MAG: nucleotidyl transferase AbiEii/AbiGii toxin family protein [Proteobacteria bacterium]|nr:nucleotidyl transferase AbiEii/AbiGii toxin family protein [Pseudomonadota bacterium]